MTQNNLPYRTVELPPGRRIWINTMDMGGPKHCIYGLLEVDVTVPRLMIAQHEAETGEALSFTGFVIHCLAQAVAENKEVQAYRQGRKQLVVYDDVHVGMMVEHQAGEKRALMGHVVQNANRKTLRQVHDEIRGVQAAPAPPNRGMPDWFRKAMLMPPPVPGLLRRMLALQGSRDPSFRVAMGGTVFVTAIGMFGEGHSGWGITTTPHSLSVVVGSMAWKPAVVHGCVEPREILNLTLLFDHDVVDGAPATRFTVRLVELLESGYGLEEA